MKISFDKKTAPILILPMKFYWINEPMNESDELWRRVHQKYGISWIIRRLHLIKIKTALTLLLPMMFNLINKTTNESDVIWRWVHQKYMEWFKSWKTALDKKHLLLPSYYWQCNIELTKKWMRLMHYEGECIENMEWVKSYGNWIWSKKEPLLPCY